MRARFRFSLITVTTLAVLVVNAIWTVPALADDGTPPPADTAVETPTTTPTAEPVVENSTPVEAQPLPEGTEVVVTNEEGQILPLASNEAAQVLAGGDPQWCPVGVAPGSASCTTPGQTSFDDLLTELSTYNAGAGPNKAGVIWIEGNYQSSSNDPGIPSFTFAGTTLTEMAKYALTIQGGWTGTGKVIDQLAPSEFNASLSILDWSGAITLNDILIKGATANPNFGTAGTSALIVESLQSITLNRVQITESANHLNGADLYNQSSPYLSPVTVYESIFNHNNGSGLRVSSAGAINIRNLTANFNGTDDAGANWDYGAFITNWNPGPDTNKPITLTGMNQFKGNLGTGLFASSYGVVTLSNIVAYANDDITDGDGGDGLGVIVDTSASIKMLGTNLINYNQTNGLEFYSDGTISLNNVNASNNGGGGTVLNNCANSGLNTPCSIVGKPVTLTGTNVFNENGLEGLVVQTDGAISISNITALNNGSFGAYLDNCAFDSVTLHACTNTLPYAVSILTPSKFLNNADTGLYIQTTGAVTLKGVTASFNHNMGVDIDNSASLLKPQNVILSGVNTFNGNDNRGLSIVSFGSITLGTVTANDNGLVDLCATCYGVYVDNVGYSGVPISGSVLLARKPITFSGVNTFNNNHLAGALIYSVGAVTMSNVTAMGNGTDGVNIGNDWDWHPNGAVAATAYSANVTLNGYGVFENNGDEGLQIDSRGAVKLNNLTASDNTDVGVYVDNSGYVGAPTSYSALVTRQAVTIAGTNSFNNNDGGGLYVYSLGAITLSNITAIGNLQTGTTGSGHGVLVSNDLPWYPKGVGPANYAANVTLTGYGYFEDNYDDGLYVQSRGIVTMSNLTANNNGDNGVYISNTGDVLPQNVTISGVNNFVGNGFSSVTVGEFDDGLYIQTNGKITISNLNAIGNKGNGAWLDNLTDKIDNKFLGITLTGTSVFQLNQGANGLYATSDGTVTMTNINADDNTGNGFQVNATKNITLMCAGAYSNTGTGFLLTSTSGVITLKGVHAYGNGTDETFSPISPIRTWNCP